MALVRAKETFIAYKAVRTKVTEIMFGSAPFLRGTGIAIVLLRITKGTWCNFGNPKRQHIWDRKCRAEKATVLSVRNARTGKQIAVGYSCYDREFVYRKGDVVKSTNGKFTRRIDVCAHGIHFFMKLSDAEVYLK